LICPFKNEDIGQMLAIKGRNTAFLGQKIKKVNKTARMDAPRAQNSVCRRSVHLPRRVFAKPENLFQVMLPMHQMKLSPLRRVQWAQNRMIE
jgi:hypothetical protein